MTPLLTKSKAAIGIFIDESVPKPVQRELRSEMTKLPKRFKEYIFLEPQYVQIVVANLASAKSRKMERRTGCKIVSPAQFFSYVCRILHHCRKAALQKNLQKAPKKLRSKPSASGTASANGNASRTLSSFIRVDDISGRFRPEILENPSRFYALPGKNFKPKQRSRLKLENPVTAASKRKEQPSPVLFRERFKSRYCALCHMELDLENIEAHLFSAIHAHSVKTKFQAIDDEIAAFKAERFGRQMETNEFDADAPKIFSKETKEKKNFAETESLLSIGAENDNSGLGPVPLLLDLAMNALLEFNARSLQKCEKKKSYVKNIALSKPCLEPMHAVTDSSGKDKPTPRTVTVPLLLQMAFDAFALSRAKV